jgi:DNA-binding Lrp family transcriptional regulator
MPLNNRDRKLLNLIQSEFPLTGEPFADLAQRLGTSVDETLRDIARLKGAGIVRMIGPVMDSRSLGFHTTLVAMKVADASLEKAEQVIADHPGVSHGYERSHRFNVWFTLALPSIMSIEGELQSLTQSTGAEVAFSLPALRVFKIGAYFDMDEDSRTIPVTYGRTALISQVELSGVDRRIINELQQDLPLVPAPFSAMAAKTDMNTEEFLVGCRSLQERGVIRRFSASINHRNAGFTANAMSCWAAPPDKIDAAGRMLASLRNVSHCYERKTNRYWQYGLLAMVHGRFREVCQDVAEKVSRQTGLTDFALLYSTKEFKKTRVKYLV